MIPGWFRKHLHHWEGFDAGYHVDTDPTNRGITLRAFQDYHQAVGIDSGAHKTLTDDQAFKFYNYWWKHYRFNEMHAPGNVIYFDWWITSKTSATRAIQKAAGITQDGIIGPLTIQAVNRMTPRAIHELRLLYYANLVAAKPHLAQYRDGWLNRSNALFHSVTQRQLMALAGLIVPLLI